MLLQTILNSSIHENVYKHRSAIVIDLHGSGKVMRTFADISNSIVHDNVSVSSAPAFPVVLPRPAVLRQGVMKKGWLRIPNRPIPQPASQGACAGGCAGLVRGLCGHFRARGPISAILRRSINQRFYWSWRGSCVLSQTVSKLRGINFVTRHPLKSCKTH
jgi:hypothetical protein